MLPSLLAVALLGAAGARPPSHPGPRRTLQRREIALTDANAQEVPVVHVARGVPTTVSFGQAIRRESVLLADTSDSFAPPKATDSTVVLIPNRDLAPGSVATLTVTLADGTLVPLLLDTVLRTADIAVDVAVSLARKAAPESVGALKTLVLQLRGELDDCRGDGAAAGATKLARLLLDQDGKESAPVVPLEVHRRDRQDRMVVEVTRAYRLFGSTYLLLTLENRDPSAVWALGKAEVEAGSGRSLLPVPVLAAEMDVAAIAPNEAGHLVLAFRTPAAGGERVTVQLLERSGTRSVRLTDLAL